jgi:hypothetical protein
MLATGAVTDFVAAFALATGAVTDLTTAAFVTSADGLVIGPVVAAFVVGTC